MMRLIFRKNPWRITSFRGDYTTGRKSEKGGADVRKKRTFTVKVEFTPDAIPIEKALDSLAKVIARKMYEERHGKKEAKA